MLNKIINKIKAIIFYLYYFHIFKKFGKGSYIMKKLRLDGAQYITIGNNVTVQKYSWLYAGKIDDIKPEIEIGEGSVLGNFNHIAAVHKVVLGKKVLTADRVYISDNMHVFNDINIPIMDQGIIFKSDVYIGDGSWIGENVSIIGAKIGKNCVIGSNSVVTNDIPDYSVAVGSPAQVIKHYNMGTMKWEKMT